MSAFLTASAIAFEGLENVENSDGKNDVKIVERTCRFLGNR